MDADDRTCNSQDGGQTGTLAATVGNLKTHSQEVPIMRACTLIGLVSALLTPNCLPVAAAERLIIVAGGGERGDGAKAVDARLHSPFGVEIDQMGNMFIVELEGG